MRIKTCYNMIFLLVKINNAWCSICNCDDATTPIKTLNRPILDQESTC